jgi:hypothetical protein
MRTARTIRVTAPQSGSILLNVAPIGSLDLPITNILDLRLEKAFALQGHKGAVRVNMFNALNNNAATAITVLSGPSYLVPTAITPPRILEFSASFYF